jgi:hypothetical protein
MGEPKAPPLSQTRLEAAEDGCKSHVPHRNQRQQQYPQVQLQSLRQGTRNNHVDSTKPLRGLLKLLEGQIAPPLLESANANAINERGTTNVDCYRYHGPTLRESQKELQKRKRTSRKNKNAAEVEADVPLLLQHSKHSTNFHTAVRRHKFVAFFVVQGIQNVGGNPCYSAHTLNLRTILATDYHDVMTTFVLDLGGNGSGSIGGSNAMLPFGDCDDEEDGGAVAAARDNDDNNAEPQSHPFSKGTGFCLFPTTPFSVSTTLALLNVSKIPSMVVLDSFTGKVVSRDAIISIERNDSHTVVNRWQSGRSGLSLWQQMGAVATCDCAHGPCCSGGGGSCCVIQ